MQEGTQPKRENSMGLFDNIIDKTTRIPFYFQLKEIIMNEIRSGNYPIDSMIPTEKEIGDFFQISRTTVRQAITELVQEGWLYRVKSKGTFVSHPKLNQDFIQQLESYDDQIRRSGMTPRTEVLDMKVTKATSAVASNLKIDVSDKVIYLYRKRFSDNEPMVTIKTYLPYDKCAYVMEHNLDEESLYAVLRKTDLTEIRYVNRVMEVALSAQEDVETLNTKKGDPIQLITSVGYNVFDCPIEYSIARYRGDRNSFRITVYPRSR